MSARAPVFIVLPTDAIGGAEKRFAGLWRYFQRHGERHVQLVVRRGLADHLRGLTELAPFPEGGFEIVDDEDGDWLGPMRRRLAALHRAHPGAVFHFVLVSPVLVQRFRSPRTLYTCAASSLELFNWRGRLGVYAAVALASRIDALDDRVMRQLARLFPFKRGAMSATPNSFVDLEAYASAPVKRDRLAFLGLFSEEKQIFRLVDALPAIDARLKAAGLRPEFRLMGRETRTPGVAEVCAKLRPGVDVEVTYEANPARVLREAKVFFSLQRQSNYPSKSLLEAMACGCVPVVTDVGTTRRLAREDFAVYLPRDFSPADAADACLKAMTLPEAERARREAAMRELLARDFSLASMAAYFRMLYDQLALLT